MIQRQLAVGTSSFAGLDSRRVRRAARANIVQKKVCDRLSSLRLTSLETLDSPVADLCRLVDRRPLQKGLTGGEFA